MTTTDRCTWCKKPGHTADQHPLPPDHPDYDAFWDAPDGRLAAMLSDSLREDR